MSHPSVLAATLLLTAVACMGQTRPAPAHTVPQTTKTPVKTPAKQAMKSDSEIEAAIRAKFARSRLAKTGGAVAVNNHVAISDAARQKAADNLDQGRRRAQVK